MRPVCGGVCVELRVVIRLLFIYALLPACWWLLRCYSLAGLFVRVYLQDSVGLLARSLCAFI